MTVRVFLRRVLPDELRLVPNVRALYAARHRSSTAATAGVIVGKAVTQP
ncbi:hypothetical protein AB0F88_31760 [Streptosporangium sp. NPDC023963]